MENTDILNKKPLRQIIIETDGSKVRVVKSEVYSLLEFNSILQTVSDFINNPPEVKAPKVEEPVVEENVQIATPIIENNTEGIK